MINIKMQPTEIQKLSPKIAVIGVGGAGGNAVNNMIASELEGCEFLVCNTDAQALQNSLADHKVQLGTNVTGGLGAGSKPEVGQAAAEESLEEVLRYLDGANMAFVTAGMGGGTGTGAAPVIAKACREQGILTVGVVTKPFHFEGVHRMAQAEKGIEAMQQYVDTLIVIPNQNLFRIANEKTTFAEGFKMADTVLQSGVRGVTDLMVRPGLVNLDFADIRTAMLQMGKAMMGTGEASGEKRAIEAAEAAINNPLLDDVSMQGANGVIINVTGGYDMTLFEADEACNRIRDEVDPNANIIFGATFDENMDGFMRVSIVATGIDSGVSKSKIFTGGNGGGVQRPLTGRPVEPPLQNNDVNQSVASSPKEEVALSSSPEVTNGAKLYGSRSLLSGREMVKGLTAPSPLASPAPRTEIMQPVQEEKKAQIKPEGGSSLDMFEQSEFVVETMVQEETSSEVAVDRNDALRGQTINNAFIPPAPMEPDMELPENGVGGHISGFHAQHVEKIKKEGASPALKDAPVSSPVPTRAARTPSLLERITGSVQHHIDSFRDDNNMIRSEKPQIEERPSQGRLNIDSPAARPAIKIDDELDIPAFLRRQAN